MNIKSIKNPHLIVELFLCFIVVYLFAQKSETIIVKNPPIPQDTVLNFALLKNKSIVLVDRDGHLVNDVNGKPIISSKDSKLHAIAISIEAGGADGLHISDSLLNMVIKPAHAAHLYKYYIRSDTQVACYWVDDGHRC